MMRSHSLIHAAISESSSPCTELPPVCMSHVLPEGIGACTPGVCSPVRGARACALANVSVHLDRRHNTPQQTSRREAYKSVTLVCICKVNQIELIRTDGTYQARVSRSLCCPTVTKEPTVPCRTPKSLCQRWLAACHKVIKDRRRVLGSTAQGVERGKERKTKERYLYM
jgi:hypothetical protein